jgi:hypothetical protein
MLHQKILEIQEFYFNYLIITHELSIRESLNKQEIPIAFGIMRIRCETFENKIMIK